MSERVNENDISGNFPITSVIALVFKFKTISYFLVRPVFRDINFQYLFRIMNQNFGICSGLVFAEPLKMSKGLPGGGG